MQLKQIKKVLRDNGVKMSDTLSSSRVRGWGSLTSGVTIKGFFPWKSTSQYKYRRFTHIVPERTQKIRLGEYKTDTEMPRVKEAFKKHDIHFTEIEGGIEIEIDNPYSEKEAKESKERNDRLMALIRQSR